MFGKVETRLKNIEDEAYALDLLADERPLLGSEISRRKEVREEAWRLSKMLEWIWRQKSRINWANKGDENTKYFHIMACSRNSRNYLSSLFANG